MRNRASCDFAMKYKCIISDKKFENTELQPQHNLSVIFSCTPCLIQTEYFQLVRMYPYLILQTVSKVHVLKHIWRESLISIEMNDVVLNRVSPDPQHFHLLGKFCFYALQQGTFTLPWLEVFVYTLKYFSSLNSVLILMLELVFETFWDTSRPS